MRARAKSSDGTILNVPHLMTGMDTAIAAIEPASPHNTEFNFIAFFMVSLWDYSAIASQSILYSRHFFGLAYRHHKENQSSRPSLRHIESSDLAPP